MLIIDFLGNSILIHRKHFSDTQNIYYYYNKSFVHLQPNKHLFYKREYFLGAREKKIAAQYAQNNYMIDTFLFIRILNPISLENYQEISEFSQKIDIYSD